jgi:hypothetical protein
VRLPLAFGQFNGKISASDEKVLLPPETATLIGERVPRTNGLGSQFAVDFGRKLLGGHWHPVSTNRLHKS